MSTELPPLVETTATRLTLHRLAEDVLAAEQVAANGDFRLEALTDGFATRWYADGNGTRRRTRIIGGELIRETEHASVREPITGDFEPQAASVLYAWWDLGTQVLSAFAAEYGAKSSDVVLYPEHFDVGSSLDLGEHAQINLGFSPGDEFSPTPYVYAGPWEQRTGEFWNAPFGAYRRYDEFDPHTADEGTRAFLAAAIAQLPSAATA